MPEGQTLDAPRLYVAMYGAHAVANWDKGRRDADGVYQTQMVVLDETEQVRGENFTWDEVEKYRVLSVHQSVNLMTLKSKDQKAIMSGCLLKMAMA